MRSENPALDAERYMMAMDILQAMRPQCHCCGRHIQENFALHYEAKDIDIWLCPDCVMDNKEYIEVD